MRPICKASRPCPVSFRPAEPICRQAILYITVRCFVQECYVSQKFDQNAAAQDLTEEQFFFEFRAFRSITTIAGPGGVIGLLRRPKHRWANHPEKVARRPGVPTHFYSALISIQRHRPCHFMEFELWIS